jgi:hypothetical protein
VRGDQCVFDPSSDGARGGARNSVKNVVDVTLLSSALTERLQGQDSALEVLFLRHGRRDSRSRGLRSGIRKRS